MIRYIHQYQPQYIYMASVHSLKCKHLLWIHFSQVSRGSFPRSLTLSARKDSISFAFSQVPRLRASETPTFHLAAGKAHAIY